HREEPRPEDAAEAERAEPDAGRRQGARAAHRQPLGANRKLPRRAGLTARAALLRYPSGVSHGRRRMKHWNSRAAWPLAAVLLAPLPAAALLNDRVEVFAAENVTYDNNVFRLSPSLDPRTTIGRDQRSDWVSTTSLGVNVDVPWSL